MYFQPFSRRHKYVVQNLQKYGGNYFEIELRSRLEYKFCEWLDLNDDVIFWNYESFSIRYFNPVRKKYSSYTPDFYVILGNYFRKSYVVEVKSISNINIEYVEDEEFLTEKEHFFYRRYIDSTTINDWKFCTLHDFLKPKEIDFYIYTEEGFIKPVFNKEQNVDIILKNLFIH